MTTTPRRARLINGHAVTFTDTGAIIDGLEILYEPSRDEASREIGARQRTYMLAGVEAHEALAMALSRRCTELPTSGEWAEDASLLPWLTLVRHRATVGGPERPARGE